MRWNKAAASLWDQEGLRAIISAVRFSWFYLPHNHSCRQVTGPLLWFKHEWRWQVAWAHCWKSVWRFGICAYLRGGEHKMRDSISLAALLQPGSLFPLFLKQNHHVLWSKVTNIICDHLPEHWFKDFDMSIDQVLQLTLRIKNSSIMFSWLPILILRW